MMHLLVLVFCIIWLVVLVSRYRLFRFMLMVWNQMSSSKSRILLVLVLLGSAALLIRMLMWLSVVMVVFMSAVICVGIVMLVSWLSVWWLSVVILLVIDVEPC